MNTRTYPRTSAEAFKGCDYACALERPAPRRPWRFWLAGALWYVVIVAIWGAK